LQTPETGRDTKKESTEFWFKQHHYFSIGVGIVDNSSHYEIVHPHCNYTDQKVPVQSAFFLRMVTSVFIKAQLLEAALWGETVPKFLEAISDF